MARLRNWHALILAAAALAVAGGLALRLTHRPPSPAAAEIRLWSVDMRRIARIEIARPSAGTLARFSRRDGIWSGDGADTLAPEIWSGVPLILGRPRVDLVTETPDGMAQFGLDAPQLTVVLWTEDGSTRAAEVGGRLPDGSGYYVRLHEGAAVYAVDTSWVDALAGAEAAFGGPAGAGVRSEGE